MIENRAKPLKAFRENFIKTRYNIVCNNASTTLAVLLETLKPWSDTLVLGFTVQNVVACCSDKCNTALASAASSVRNNFICDWARIAL